MIPRYLRLDEKRCSVCGETKLLTPVDKMFLRGEDVGKTLYVELHRCPVCDCSWRYRQLADVLLEHYGAAHASLASLVHDDAMRRLRVYEPGAVSPLRPFLMRLPHYLWSDYDAGRALGAMNGNAPRNEDLHALTLADGSLDLVLTADIFEHLHDPWQAFSEVRRVLAPGGRHVFLLPFQDPLPKETVTRIARRDGVDIDLLPRQEHTGFDGTAFPVYTDFGADLPERLQSLGLPTELHRPSEGMPQRLGLITLCSKVEE